MGRNDDLFRGELNLGWGRLLRCTPALQVVQDGRYFRERPREGGQHTQGRGSVQLLPVGSHALQLLLGHVGLREQSAQGLDCHTGQPVQRLAYDLGGLLASIVVLICSLSLCGRRATCGFNRQLPQMGLAQRRPVFFSGVLLKRAKANAVLGRKLPKEGRLGFVTHFSLTAWITTGESLLLTLTSPERRYTSGGHRCQPCEEGPRRQGLLLRPLSSIWRLRQGIPHVLIGSACCQLRPMRVSSAQGPARLALPLTSDS